jgi:exodeoxyribonuclease-3
VRLATWNVNSLTARWPRVEAWLAERDVDVLLIQETKQSDAKFPFEAFARLGYEAAHYGQGQWNGVAVVSRVGLDAVTRGFGDQDPEARLIAATCAGVRVYSCYVPNGRALDDPHYAYKLRWLASLRDLLAARAPDEPTAVGGDFNVAPSDLDCFDPAQFVGATHVSEPERAALRELIATGLVDVARAVSPDEPMYTWWDYRNGAFHRGWGLRIDLLLLDAASAATVRSCQVDREARKGVKPSDHAPVVVDFAAPSR